MVRQKIGRSSCCAHRLRRWRASDADLLQRLRAGDERAFGEIVREWSPLLLRVAGSFVTTHASAEECVQEAWLAVIRGLDGFEGRSRLRTWVVGIVVNIARRRAQRDGRSVPWAAEEESGPTVDPRRFRPPGEQWAGGWTEQGAPREWEPDAVLLAARSWSCSRAGWPSCRRASGRSSRSATCTA